MGLEQVRDCRIVIENNSVTISGLCKKYGKKVSVSLLRNEYDDWQNGIPLYFATERITCAELYFLLTGVYECQE